MLPTAYGTSVPEIANVADADRSGGASFSGSMDALADNATLANP